MKTFYVQHNIGRAKYVVNYHNGTNQHDDGSPFFDIAICKNKRQLADCIKDLKQQGYQEARP